MNNETFSEIPSNISQNPPKISTVSRLRVLLLTTLAMFVSYLVWFNFPPLALAIQDDLGLTNAERGLIGLGNVLITLPARIVIGMLVDKYGPRIIFSALLVGAAVPCFIFASANSFELLMLSRICIGIIGAGFVAGVRILAEWFPNKFSGLFQGLYASWGNLGSAAAAIYLIRVAGLLAVVPGESILSTSNVDLNWRAAIALTGILSAICGVIYYWGVRDTPPGRRFQRPARHGGMEVTSRKDFYLLLISNSAFLGTMLLLAWRLSLAGLYDTNSLVVVAALLGTIFLYQSYSAWTVNQPLMVGTRHYPSEERYRFSQVALLELTCLIGLGFELATTTVLPVFLTQVFGVAVRPAGLIAGCWIFLNVFFRPFGGLLSDLGNRKWVMVLLGVGTGLSYLFLGSTSSSSNVITAILAIFACIFFVQAGQGSTYAMVPLIVRRLTGQVAGNVTAYGNVGAVLALTIWSSLPKATETLAVSFQNLFLLLGATGLIVALLCGLFLRDPNLSVDPV